MSKMSWRSIRSVSVAISGATDTVKCSPVTLALPINTGSTLTFQLGLVAMKK
jgi:hypothetical protein